MKFLFALTTVLLFTACSHTRKESLVSFKEEEKTYSANVMLPKNISTSVPLVVIVHEWWGRTDYIEKRSQMLNEAGFATLAVDFYGDNKIAKDPEEAKKYASVFYQKPELGVARLDKYIEGAKQNPYIDTTQIYVIGYCFGGTQALNYARSGANIKGVVSFHGGLAAGVKAKNLSAKVLAINGLSDPMVPEKERKAFDTEMKSIKANYQVKNYPNATHAFTNPEATELGKKFNLPISYNEQADRGSWNDLLAFLRQ